MTRIILRDIRRVETHKDLQKILMSCIENLKNKKYCYAAVYEIEFEKRGKFQLRKGRNITSLTTERRAYIFDTYLDPNVNNLYVRVAEIRETQYRGYPCYSCKGMLLRIGPINKDKLQDPMLRVVLESILREGYSNVKRSFITGRVVEEGIRQIVDDIKRIARKYASMEVYVTGEALIDSILDREWEIEQACDLEKYLKEHGYIG